VVATANAVLTVDLTHVRKFHRCQKESRGQFQDGFEWKGETTVTKAMTVATNFAELPPDDGPWLCAEAREVQEYPYCTKKSLSKGRVYYNAVVTWSRRFKFDHLPQCTRGHSDKRLGPLLRWRKR
jgi:hypothetical protein